MKKILLIITIGLIQLSFVRAQNTFSKITLEDLFNKRTFLARSVYGLNSMNDGIHYSTRDYRGNVILKHSYATGNVVDTICKISDTGLSDIADYSFSPDESKILFETNNESIYRHSYTADYYIWDIKNKSLQSLSDKKAVQLATFSEDGLKVAFVYENNLYFKDLTNGRETQFTSDGKKNNILNGLPDWVYEEEFGFSKAFEWSPDGKRIAYIQFNESRVKTFDMTVYAGLSPKLEENAMYPENRQWKYPKAGEENSIVNVFIYDLQTQKTVKAAIGTETDIYIPRIRWTSDPNQLGVIRLNRLQNKFELLFTDASTGTSKIVYTDENKYYIDESVLDDLNFLPDNQFVITSERDGFQHIYLYNYDGSLVKQITQGYWDVTAYLGFDEKNKIFYYESAEEHPTKRAVYAIDLKGKKKLKLSTQEGTNRASFSKGHKYFINYFTNSTTPNYITLHDSKGKLIRVLEDNAILKEKVKEYGGVNKSFFSFKITEGIELNAYIIKPADFDPAKKYPLMVTQYSGPNSQSVRDAWSYGYNELLAQKGYIVACVDPRGTGARGEAFRKLSYLQLGKFETTDMIEFAKYLGNLAYVDSKRIGIWGWSYGGFMTLSCMTKGADYFKTGIAVAPVTNWRYYDNIYTERYMRKPQDNPAGYDDNSPINYASMLKGNLLLVHGTADDNVHLQNSMEMSEALVQAEKQFHQFYYTNRNHGIRGGNTSMHLYQMMLNFIEENL
jgi:dipeptidyl-peptidase-4